MIRMALFLAMLVAISSTPALGGVSQDIAALDKMHLIIIAGNAPDRDVARIDRLCSKERWEQIDRMRYNRPAAMTRQEHSAVLQASTQKTARQWWAESTVLYEIVGQKLNEKRAAVCRDIYVYYLNY